MTRLDWIAIGPRGVYALMDAEWATPRDVSKFRAAAIVAGHTTELVTVEEACRRHHDYLMQFEDMRQAAAMLAARDAPPVDLPSFLPSPAQIEMFGGNL